VTASGEAPAERTAGAVSVLHAPGAGNKPPAEDLERIRNHALFKRPMGGRTRMVHHADLPHGRPGAITADACGAEGALGAVARDALPADEPPDGPAAGDCADRSPGDFRAAAGTVADTPDGNRSPNDHASCGHLRAGRVHRAVTAAV